MVTKASHHTGTSEPPQDLEAEREALGGLLHGRVEVLDELQADDCYLDRDRRIVEAARRLHTAGKPVDEVGTAAELKREGRLEEAGGRAYLSELAAQVGVTANARHHAATVREQALLRAKRETGHRLTNGLPPEEGIAQLQAQLSRAEGLRARPVDVSRIRPVRWAWDGRIPSGYLSLLLGAEGVGKGTATAWMLSRLTRGELPGDLHGQPTPVLLIGDEDAFDSVVVPRLSAAGADLDLVHTLHEADDEIDLRRDAERLRNLITRGGFRVLYIDALLDTLGVDTDDWRSKSIRDALRPLRRMARDLDVAVLASLHPNKGQRGSFRDLLSGSHAFNASSRSSLFLTVHPDDDSRRVLVRGKGNLSAAPPSFEFAIEGRELQLNGHTFSVPLVAEPTEGELRVEDLLRPEQPAPVRRGLAEEIDAAGTGEVQSRTELAEAVGRDAKDGSVGRALGQLENEGRWEKVGRGKFRRIASATYKGGTGKETAAREEAKR